MPGSRALTYPRRHSLHGIGEEFRLLRESRADETSPVNMHARKASNPVLRLRYEETSVIKHLKTDNVQTSRPLSRGQSSLGSPSRVQEEPNKLVQKGAVSPLALRLRLGSNIEKLRSPSRLRVDSTPRFVNRNHALGSPSSRSTPPSPLATSARKSLFNNSANSGGSSPDSNYGRSPSPLSLSTQSSNKGHTIVNDEKHISRSLTSQFRSSSMGKNSLKSEENKLLKHNAYSVANASPSGASINNRSPSQWVASPAKTPSPASTRSSHLNSNVPSSLSARNMRNIAADIKGENNHNRTRYETTQELHVDAHRVKNINRSDMHSSSKYKTFSHDNPNMVAGPSIVQNRTSDNTNKFRLKYDRSLNGLKKDLEVNAYFDRDGNAKILSMYAKNESSLIHNTIHEFIDKIEKFSESSLSCQKHLLRMATKVDRNKLKLTGQRMRGMDREEKNRVLRQDVKNDIDLLSLQSERLEAEYRSLVTTLEKQKSLLKKLSSE